MKCTFETSCSHQRIILLSDLVRFLAFFFIPSSRSAFSTKPRRSFKDATFHSLPRKKELKENTRKPSTTAVDPQGTSPPSEVSEKTSPRCKQNRGPGDGQIKDQGVTGCKCVKSSRKHNQLFTGEWKS